MEMNVNNDAGRCICSFSFGIDRIWIFEVPDVNAGFISGWVFLFNTNAYFWSIAGGGERLTDNIVSAYAEYLVKVQGDADSNHSAVEIYEDEYRLTEDVNIDFHNAFFEAMTDAGFTQEESGRWEPVVEKD